MENYVGTGTFPCYQMQLLPLIASPRKAKTPFVGCLLKTKANQISLFLPSP